MFVNILTLLESADCSYSRHILVIVYFIDGSILDKNCGINGEIERDEWLPKDTLRLLMR